MLYICARRTSGHFNLVNFPILKLEGIVLILLVTFKIDIRSFPYSINKTGHKFSIGKFVVMPWFINNVDDFSHLGTVLVDYANFQFGDLAFLGKHLLILMIEIYLPAKAFAVDYVLILRGIFPSLKNKSSLAKIRFCGVNFKIL